MEPSTGLNAEQLEYWSVFIRGILEDAARLGLARVEAHGMVFIFFPRVESQAPGAEPDPWNEGL